MEPNPVLSETSQMSRKRQRNQASGASAPLIIPVRKKGEAIERKTTAIPKSNLLPRLKNFLERMKTANEELEADIEKVCVHRPLQPAVKLLSIAQHGKGKFEIDFVDAKQPQEEDINEANSDDVSNQAPMIEMNLRVVLGEEDTKLVAWGIAGREPLVSAGSLRSDRLYIRRVSRRPKMGMLEGSRVLTGKSRKGCKTSSPISHKYTSTST
eukprot:1364636-Amorphochlora_amoeboformis.AAC.2